MKQTTLFDLTPYEASTAPLVKLADDVWSIELRAQIDASDGSVRIAVQVSHAITEELAYWHLSDTRVNASEIDQLVHLEVERWRHQFAYWHSPF